MAVLLALAAAATGPASAQIPFTPTEAPSVSEPASIATDARLAGDEKQTRLVLDLSHKIDMRAFILADPYRVVIDIPQVNFQLPPKTGERGRGVIKAFRYGLVMQGGSRIVIDVTGPVRVAKAFVVDPVEGQPARMVVDLVPVDRETFLRAAAIDNRLPRQTEPPPPHRDTAAHPADPRPVVVIDPGHGGHDEGTQGPKGLLEKDLVLDVAMRLGKLIEDRMGAEVIYTRSDDTFVPLEGRTALANDKKADLFLSIHANSSPTPHVTGVETYYLNFTDSKDAIDVASRENASSQKSVFELRDIIERISAHDKAEESRDFASRIQTALFAFSSKTFTAERNRGVRKAPFVVLIGASMPSVLVEIGFLSNSREEALLSKPEYRQKLAEALFRGLTKYAEGLSHFQVAEN